MVREIARAAKSNAGEEPRQMRGGQSGARNKPLSAGRSDQYRDYQRPVSMLLPFGRRQQG